MFNYNVSAFPGVMVTICLWVLEHLCKCCRRQARVICLEVDVAAGRLCRQDIRVFNSRLECFNQLGDRKSTRLNSSHGYISYAVFCLKKKKSKTSSAQRTA